MLKLKLINNYYTLPYLTKTIPYHNEAHLYRARDVRPRRPVSCASCLGAEKAQTFFKSDPFPGSFWLNTNFPNPKLTARPPDAGQITDKSSFKTQEKISKRKMETHKW